MKRIALFLLLTACTASTTSLPALAKDTCNAAHYAELIGQDVTALEKTLILGMVRLIRPGDMVTMDFRPERINFGIDDREKISRISCG